MGASRRQNPLSIKSRSARRHLTVAMALVAVLPLLSFLFITVRAPSVSGPTGHWTNLLVMIAALGLGLTGNAMLREYPRSIEALRRHLEAMANGQLSEDVDLQDSSDDAGAIAASLNSILAIMRKQMKTLEAQLAASERMQQTIREQERQLRETERHQVMIQSLATACHHIGQPATVLRLYIESMARSNTDAGKEKTIAECRDAIEAIAGILDRLRQVESYRPVPYPVSAEDQGQQTREHILDI